MPIPIGVGLAAKTLLTTAASTAVRTAPTLIKPLAQQTTRAASQMPLAAAARPTAAGGINQLRANLLPAFKQSAAEHGKQAIVDGAHSALMQTLTKTPGQPAQTPPMAGPVPHNGDVPR